MIVLLSEIIALQRYKNIKIQSGKSLVGKKEKTRQSYLQLINLRRRLMGFNRRE